MNTINRNFLKSLWIELTEPLKEKLLINVAYCSNAILSKFFLNEMLSEVSNVYSSTDNLNQKTNTRSGYQKNCVVSFTKKIVFSINGKRL